jgi:hypothetical protein
VKRIATLLLSVIAWCAVASPAVAVPRVPTTVTTTLHSFEFNAYFGPPFATIDCELDNGLPNNGAALTEAYCMSSTPRLTHHVTLPKSGRVSVCRGVSCGSNPGLGTPTLSPGTRIISRNFTCVIQWQKVTCTRHDGHGFVMTLTGVTKR